MEKGSKWYCAKYSYKRRNRMLIADASGIHPQEEKDDTRHSNLTTVCKL